MRCLPVLVLALLLPALGAAEPKPKKPAAEGGIAGSGAADAAEAFARQAGQAPQPVGAVPAIIGSYVWGGRADEAYRPFFQWEFRLKAGSAISGLRLRTVALNPDRSAAATGEWKPVGALAAGAKVDISIKQNCSAFASYQVDAEWTGGSARWVAADKTTLPVSLAAIANGPYLLATAYNHDPDNKTKATVISWWLWNLGGVAASETVQTVAFMDQGGKTIASHEVKTGDVPAGSAKEHTLKLPKAPAGYTAISVSARCADTGGSVAIDPGFTDAKEVEVAAVRAEGKRLHARVRNGLDRTLARLTVTLTLTDKDGAALKAITMKPVDLGPGAQGDLVGELGDATGWAGYEMTWSVAAPAASAGSAAGADAAAPPVLAVRGLEFRQTAAVVEGGTLHLKGELSNRTGRRLNALAVTFAASGDGKASETVYEHDGLDPDDSAAVVIAVPGITAIERLDLSWTAK